MRTNKSKYRYKLFLVAKPTKDGSTTISASPAEYEKMLHYAGQDSAVVSRFALDASKEIDDNGVESWSTQVKAKLVHKLRGYYRPEVATVDGLDPTAVLAEVNNAYWD